MGSPARHDGEDADLESDDGWGDYNLPPMPKSPSSESGESDTPPPDDDPMQDATPVAAAETEGELFSGIGEADDSTNTFGVTEEEEDNSEAFRDDSQWWPWTNREVCFVSGCRICCINLISCRRRFLIS